MNAPGPHNLVSPYINDKNLMMTLDVETDRRNWDQIDKDK
jgi:hypothetical protein